MLVRTVTVALFAILAGTATPVCGQHKERDEYARRLTKEVIAARDRNRNGQLDRDEIKLTSQGKVDGDLNRDGILTTRELYMRYYQRAPVQGTSSNTQATAMSPLEIEELVRGFGVEEEVTPIRGFGPAAEATKTLSPAETARQEAEAKRLISFYTALDANKNGRLEPSEIAASRYRDTVSRRIREAGMDPTRPIDYSKFIKKRLSNAGVSSSTGRRVLKATASAPKATGRYARKSTSSRTSRDRRARDKQPELPEWITERDKDGDRQVSLVEFATELSDELVGEFLALDRNNDGLVTPDEYLNATED